MKYRVLDPTSETEAEAAALAPRLADLAGKTVGFISNGKEGTRGFFRHLDEMLRTELGVAAVVHRVKSNYSAPADAAIMAEAAGWDAAVTGLGD
mgnify:CR=1 FL=1|jgi:hypothetical protein